MPDGHGVEIPERSLAGTMAEGYDLRRPDRRHLDDLHRINQACVPGVGTLTKPDLRDLIGTSLITLAAMKDGRPAGFILCLGEGAAYGSPNYGWFARRHRRFAYVDRIGVDATARGRGLGEALYGHLIGELAGRRPVLCCEVNTDPPNPGSMRFHQRLGFREVGRATHREKNISVAFLERQTEAPDTDRKHATTGLP